VFLQEDSSLTRSDAYLSDLFKRAGYTVLASTLQKNFPKDLFKVCVNIWENPLIDTKVYRLSQMVSGPAADNLSVCSMAIGFDFAAHVGLLSFCWSEC